MKKKKISAIKNYIGKGGAIAFEHGFRYFCYLPSVLRGDEKIQIFIITSKEITIGLNGHCYNVKYSSLDENDIDKVISSIKSYISYLKANEYVSDDMEEIKVL